MMWLVQVSFLCFNVAAWYLEEILLDLAITVTEGLKFELHGIFKQKNSLTQTFAESCVDFEIAHLSVLTSMVQRLPYRRFYLDLFILQ